MNHGKLISLSLVAVLFFLFSGIAFAQDAIECKPPWVMILLDKSGSMGGDGDPTTGGTQTKWSIAETAINTMVTKHQTSIAFGITVYPYTDSCNLPPFNSIYHQTTNTGGNYVEPQFSGGTNNQAAKIKAYLEKYSQGGSTPIIRSLTATKEYFKANINKFKDQRRFIMLITDGEEKCDESGRINAMRDIARMLSEGCFNVANPTQESIDQATCNSAGWQKFEIRTFVIGFGTGISADELNTIAVYGGTYNFFTGHSQANCLNNTVNCFLSAVNPTQFANEIDKIAVEIGTEICDGKDNNCDGQVDEDFNVYNNHKPADGKQTCTGVGICSVKNGTKECKNETEVQCSVDPGGTEDLSEAEKCDGLDNDCDGKIDEDFIDVVSKNPVGGDCDPPGECGPGTVVCISLDTAVCSTGPDGPQSQVQPEICDGKDNDCDGKIDEEQDVQTTCGKGQCQHSVPGCLDGKPLTCDPFDGKQDEQCDNLDNDCDGMVDNFLANCDNQCGSGKKLCVNGKFGECSAAQPGEEICDGIDNDCNGLTDDKAKCPDSDQVCYCGKCQKPAVGGECLKGFPFNGFCVENECPNGLTCNNSSGQCDGDPIKPPPGPDPEPLPWEPDEDANNGNDGDNPGNDANNGSDGDNPGNDTSGNDGDNPFKFDTNGGNDDGNNPGNDANNGNNDSGNGSADGGTSGEGEKSSGCGCTLQSANHTNELVGAMVFLLIAGFFFRRRRTVFER